MANCVPQAVTTGPPSSFISHVVTIGPPVTTRQSLSRFYSAQPANGKVCIQFRVVEV
ncbi:X-linked retinitis pigmentosa GTPase regulator [Gossypium arboreum]|uniref:X-linked retinitis pigmentosa GTPase regulator n=1 Tax=Gossypium arboreum TaxID=29729 RepID=A0A0B0MAH5_GOSAR|nr:X-linked retinitis pigmentosa GTPase regulator [Gossypium arboreum]